MPIRPVIERVSLDQLSPHPRNARVGDVGAIVESIRAFGQYRTIVAQRRPEGLRILAGTHTWKAMVAAGELEADVSVLDVDDATGDRIMLADNQTHDLGHNDDRILADLLRDLAEDDPISLVGTGFSPEDLDDLLARLDEPVRPSRDPNAIPPVPTAEQTYVKLGELWLLGEHRLLVGDSTKAQQVDRLLAGAKPNLMITDPPYGVDYDPSWRNAVAEGRGWAPSRRLGEVTNDDRADWTAAWGLVPSDVIYVWHGGLHAGVVAASLEIHGFEIRGQIIWDKGRPVFGRGAYHWQHEPCYYAVRKGANASWIGDRKQTTVWAIDHLMGTRQATAEDPWTQHGTQKPVEAMARPMRNHEGDVYDPFLGSGTTMIAAQRTGRRCYAMELEPRYAQMSIERWQTFTGQNARLAVDESTAQG